MKITFFILSLHFVLVSYSQNQITSVYKSQEKDTINSIELNEKRSVFINYPIIFDFTLKKEFPLIIIMDWEDQVANKTLIQTLDFYSYNNLIPTAIIISVASAQKDGDRMKLFSDNELNNSFQNFVLKEVPEYFEKKGITISNITYIGQSRGAELGLNLALSSNNKIKNFLLSSGFYSNVMNDLKKLNQLNSLDKNIFFNWVNSDDESNFNLEKNIKNKNFHFQLEKYGNHQSTVIQNINNIVKIYSQYYNLDRQYQINEETDLIKYIKDYNSLNLTENQSINYNSITVSDICWNINHIQNNSDNAIKCYDFFFDQVGVYNPEWVIDYIQLLPKNSAQYFKIKNNLLNIIDKGGYNQILSDSQKSQLIEFLNE